MIKQNKEARLEQPEKQKKCQKKGKPQIQQIVNTFIEEIITTTIKSAFPLFAHLKIGKQTNSKRTYVTKGKDKCNIKRLTNTRTKKKYAKYTEQFNTFNALNLHSTKMHPKVRIMCKKETCSLGTNSAVNLETHHDNVCPQRVDLQHM